MTITNIHGRREQLDSARVVSVINIAGIYDNGISNNGVEASIQGSTSTLVVDSVSLEDDDRLALIAQTNPAHNGMYKVTGIGTAFKLIRVNDFQSAHQMRAGQYFYTEAGAGSGPDTGAGLGFTLIEPSPTAVGIDAVTFVANAQTGGGGFFAFEETITQQEMSGVSPEHVLIAAPTPTAQFRIYAMWVAFSADLFTSTAPGGSTLEIDGGTALLAEMDLTLLRTDISNTAWGHSFLLGFFPTDAMNTLTLAGHGLVIHPASTSFADEAGGQFVISGLAEQIA